MSWYGGFRPYVPVAQRQANAAAFARKLAKKEGRELAPVVIEGRKIAASFWGQAWCHHLERFSDYANRLPRGMTYVRNGSVIDLLIQPGKVHAYVAGSEVYTVKIEIKTLAPAAWERIKTDCGHSVASLLDLLQGRFDKGVMERLTDPRDGLFPQPAEIKLKCSCPDWAGMCKHLAATLYGVGARLDTAPELLFTLRRVNHLDLVQHALGSENLEQALDGGENALAGADLEQMFGIELDAAPARPARGRKTASGAPAKRPARRKPSEAAPPATTAEPPATAPPVAEKPTPSPKRGRGKSKSSTASVRSTAASEAAPASRAPASPPRKRSRRTPK